MALSLVGLRTLTTCAGRSLLTTRTATFTTASKSLYLWNESLLKTSPAAGAIVSKRWSTHGNHAPMWTAERILSGALLAVVPGSFFISASIADYALAMALVIHVHWGVEAIVVDYIRPSIFGPVIPKVALSLLYVLSILSLGGLFYFNYTDCGLVNAIRMAWKKL